MSGPGQGGAHPTFEFPLTPGLALSFQRYPLPESSVLHDLPRSWGALPLVDAEPGRLLLPVPDGEGVWLGLLPDRGRPAQAVQVVALLSLRGAVDATTGLPFGEAATWNLVPPLRSLPGVALGGDAWWPLIRAAPDPGTPSCVELTVRARPAQAHPSGTDAEGEASVRVSLVAPTVVEVGTGHRVPPLRPDAPYGGWRLP